MKREIENLNEARLAELSACEIQLLKALSEYWKAKHEKSLEKRKISDAPVLSSF
jgi:hypothetical protein